MKKNRIFKLLVAGSLITSPALSGAVVTHSQVVMNSKDSVAFARLTDQFDRLTNALIEINNNPAMTSSDRSSLVQTIIKKDQVAEELSKTLTSYFLQQKISPEEDQVDLKLRSIHKQLVLLNSIKNEPDLENAAQLGEEISSFKQMFLTKMTHNKPKTTDDADLAELKAMIDEAEADLSDNRTYRTNTEVVDSESSLPKTTARKVSKTTNKKNKIPPAAKPLANRSTTNQKKADYQAKRLQRLAESRRKSRLEKIQAQKLESPENKISMESAKQLSSGAARTKDYSIPNKEEAAREISNAYKEPSKSNTFSPEIAEANKAKASTKRMSPPELSSAERYKKNPRKTTQASSKEESIIKKFIFRKKLAKNENPPTEPVDDTNVRFRPNKFAANNNQSIAKKIAKIAPATEKKQANCPVCGEDTPYSQDLVDSLSPDLVHKRHTQAR